MCDVLPRGLQSPKRRPESRESHKTALRGTAHHRKLNLRNKAQTGPGLHFRVALQGDHKGQWDTKQERREDRAKL